jgi:hypothetical protein
MIGPGSLLLVVPHVFAVHVSDYGWGCQKKTKKNINMDVKNNFAGSHTEHRDHEHYSLDEEKSSSLP